MKSFPLSFALGLVILHAVTAAGAIHVVVPGDTLNLISRKNRCTVAELRAANGLTSNLIRVGQRLKLPEAAVEKPAPKPKPSVEAPVIEKETVETALKKLPDADRWKVQLFLDHALFAPGKVDGLCGEFTRKAASRWIAAENGRDMEALLSAARAQCTEIKTGFTIPETASGFVGPMPSALEEKAAAKTLLYESLVEYVAERFHTDLSTLRRLNPGMDLAALKAGDALSVPAVRPLMIENWPEAGLMEKKAVAGLRLHIAYDERMLEVLRADGTLCAAFPITVGTKPEHRRSGDWQILSLAANPSFLWDDTMLKEGRKGTTQHLLPPGPNNPVGILWMALGPVGGPKSHIGIHGTAEPARIGRNHSSGCIRLANWDIVRLAALVGKGTRVSWQSAPLRRSAPALVLAEMGAAGRSTSGTW